MPTEPTFSAYTLSQSSHYARFRRAYHPNFYKLLLNHHTRTGGALDTVLDVGCGPGIATRDLARHFASAIGIDASAGMIETARVMQEAGGGGQEALGEEARDAAGANIRFGISTAETLGSELSPPVPLSSVDLITAATAAHWFDMGAFWRRAARVLRPGGTVALWTGNSFRIHPRVPNAAAIQARMDMYNETYLRPFFEAGSHVGHGLYATLPLPWTLEEPVGEFEEGSFFRKVWAPGDTEVEGNEYVEGEMTPISLDVMEKMVGTGSPVTRWRQANPEKTGEEDIVRRMRREIEVLLREVGVKEGEEYIMGSVSAVLIMVKKKAA